MAAPAPIVMKLAAPPAGWKGGVIASVARFEKSTNSRFEPAGRAFQRAQARKSGKALTSVMLEKKVVDEATAEADAEMLALREAFDITKVSDKDSFSNYYKLMQIEEGATVKEIKKLWSVLSLVCHPDKAPTAHREKAERRFQAMQEAYSTFADKDRRRAYDSTLPFDDKIPSSKTEAKDFYTKFGACFRRNGRFSVKQPVPELGDENTPYEEVNAFYDFWFGFQSWRDFSDLDKHRASDIAGASSREERRWMKRENDTLKAQAKKDEAARVRKLVDRAEKLDPRMIAEKARINADRVAKLEAKNAKAAAEAATKKAEEEAAAAAAKAAKDEIAAEKRRKNLAKDWRKQFKKAARYFSVVLTAAHVKKVIADIELGALESLISALGNHPHKHPLDNGPNDEQLANGLARFNELRVQVLGAEEAKKAEEAEQAGAGAQAAALETDFAEWRANNSPELLAKKEEEEAARKAAAERKKAEEEAKKARGKAAAEAKAKQEAEKKAAKDKARKEAEAKRNAESAEKRKAREEKEAAARAEKAKAAEEAAAKKRAAKAAKKARKKANKVAAKANEDGVAEAGHDAEEKSSAQLAKELADDEAERKKEEEDKAAYRAERNRRKKERKKALKAQKEQELSKQQIQGGQSARRISINQPRK